MRKKKGLINLEESKLRLVVRLNQGNSTVEIDISLDSIF